MDYWTFDGYLALQAYLDAHAADRPPKLLLPGVELRVELPVDYRFNFHVLFSNQVDRRRLPEFLTHLRIGGSPGLPVSPVHFASFARTLGPDVLALHGYSSGDRARDDRMSELGMKTAQVSLDSLQRGLELFKPHEYLVIVPWDTSDGLADLAWDRHPQPAAVFCRLAHAFESRRQDSVDLFLGRRTARNERFVTSFFKNLGNVPKPVFCGSDAHSFSEYGVYPGGKATWIKADLSFEGLLQVRREPETRVYIGTEPPKLTCLRDHAPKYLTRLQVEKIPGSTLDEDWFSLDLPLNPGLVAVIGNRGSGKTALVDTLALLGNCEGSELGFLNDSRFRAGARNRAREFAATVTWGNGETERKLLSDDPQPGMPSRVKYLPQRHIEDLCDELEHSPQSRFERELKKVIFLRVPADQRLGQASLDEVISFKTKELEKAADALRTQLHEANSRVLELQQDLLPQSRTAIVAALELKRAELRTLDQSKPVEVPQPDGAAVVDPILDERLAVLQQQRIALTDELTRLLNERTLVTRKIAVSDRLLIRVRNLQSAADLFVTESKSDILELGITTESVLSLSLRTAPIISAKAALSSRLAEIRERVGESGRGGISHELSEIDAEVTEIQGKLGEPQRLRQTYLSALAAWELKRDAVLGPANSPGSISFLEERLRRIEQEIPTQLADVAASRERVVRQLALYVVELRDLYKSLFAPVTDHLAAQPLLAERLPIELDVAVSPEGFEDQFLSYIHQGRKGAFMKGEEGVSLVRKLIGAADLSTVEGIWTFVDGVLSRLEGRSESMPPLVDQLRQKVNPLDVLDYLLGLKYMRPHYTLRLWGRSISTLSPGERGALLIVFYLLLDPDDCPLIIDQPEQSLDNESVFRLLMPCFKDARERRQVIVVTHSPNLAVVCDAEQVVRCSIDKSGRNRLNYRAGSIESSDMNLSVVDVLEGTWPAFESRRSKYQGGRS